MTAIIVAAFLIAFGTTSTASAQDFYKGKTVRVIVGHNVGNDYDVGARLLTKYLPKHIPGHPAIVVQNMPQGAGIASANFLQGPAPRDGLVMGSFTRNYPNQAIMRQANVEGDPRQLNWLGATSFPSRVCIVSSTAKVKTASDLFKHELIVGGGPGVSSSNSIMPTVFNRVLGTRFRVITGYKGAQDAVLAIERGELEGVCASSAQFRPYKQQFSEGKVRVILHAEESSMPDLPGIPSIYDFVQTAEQRQFLRFVFLSAEFGRPYAFPPGVPQDRVQLMRRAIAETLKDPDLVAEAAKMGLDMSFRSADHLEKVVADLYETPPALIERVKELVPDIR